MTHTPGPWNVWRNTDADDNPIGKIQIYKQGGPMLPDRPIATVHVKMSAATDNARLIASAPTMLELLQDIEYHLSGGSALYPGSLVFSEDKPAIDVIRAAIAKATQS